MSSQPLKNRSKQLGRKAIIALKHKINANPKLKAAILLMFAPFPGLKTRIKGIKSHRHAYMSMCQIETHEQLSPYAQKIYEELKENISNAGGAN